MKNTRRLLALFLAAVLCLSGSAAAFAEPGTGAAAADDDGSKLQELELTPIDPSELEFNGLENVPEADEKEPYGENDVVRVSIVLDQASTIGAGYDIKDIAYNAAAIQYRQSLKNEQNAMTVKIQEAIGGRLDVKWNLTLIANVISANVRYGQIETIKAISGVKDVFVEKAYEIEDVKKDDPQTATSSVMTGTNVAWAQGYTGAGSKIAILDTGVDDQHLSFDAGAFEYSLAQKAEAAGMSANEYVESLDLLDAAKIAALADQLNANINASQVYLNSKIPYSYSYVDKNYDTTHLNDSQTNHGSHVTSIAAANKYVPAGDGYSLALDTVGVQGMAPDAQIINMKVFGKGGGAYDSDYMVGLEDAIILGADAANLSLGSGVAGLTFSDGYEDTMNLLVEKGMVVSISAGNAFSWYDTAFPNADMYPYIYADDVKYDTVGSPGSFPNALTVASVDNAGQTGMPIKFGDLSVFYNESNYSNLPIATLGALGELEYVLVDDPGVVPLTDADSDTGFTAIGTDHDTFAALGSDVLSGKVAICRRGQSSFYVKAEAAVAQGAVGVIIMNNQPTMIGMNLSDYTKTEPVVLISQDDSYAIIDQSESSTISGVTVYTGTLVVSDKMEISDVDISDGVVTVSDFSSWGVPESLIMKPEILAPGGSIYAVNGASPVDNVTAHDQYVSFSGTSMAAPQVAGMAAVLGEYIRDNDLETKTGLSARQLINSLLMGTASPVFDADGNYWPVLEVGSGLANVGKAVMAKSYILMDEDATMFPDSASDGKVKAELGDDPDWTGEYSYGFTIYPMEGTKEFTLRTDIFTQWLAGNGGYGMLQDYATVMLASSTTYVIDGETYEDTYALDADVNKDGKTDEADAQAILDYLTGKTAAADIDAAAADVDGDLAITTVDARLILESAATPVVEIDGPTHVAVNIALDPDDVDFLSNYFTNGFYVEGYTYIDPVATEEGAFLDVEQSVPILGFCGNWSDASMFDRTSVIDAAYETGDLPYFANSNINFMTLKKANGATKTYMINPYAVEEKYPAGRLAINPADTVAGFTYLNIRHITGGFFAVQDEDGKVLYAQQVVGERYAPYYYVNGEVWQDYSTRKANVNKLLSGIQGLNEGEKITLGFYGIPEYYAIQADKEAGNEPDTAILDVDTFKELLAAGTFGDGAAIKYTMTVDTDAPEVAAALVDAVTNNIYVRAADDNYIAYAAIMNKSGSQVFYEVVPEQTEAGQLVEIPMILEDMTLPDELTLLVADYAGNEAAFLVKLSVETPDYGGTMIAFAGVEGTAEPGAKTNRALQIFPDELVYDHNTGEYAGLGVFSQIDQYVVAAEYVDGYVFMVTDDGVNGYVYASKLTELNNAELVTVLGDMGIYDMAFNYADEKLYLMAYDTASALYTMDLITGEFTKVASLGNTIFNRLAIDDEGTFYTANSTGTTAQLYTFTLNDVTDGAVAPKAVGRMGVYNYSYGGAMAWDHNTGLLYLLSNWSESPDYDHYLWIINTETGAASRPNEVGGTGNTSGNTSGRMYNACSGLFIVPGQNHLIQPTDTATSIVVTPDSMLLLRGQTGTAAGYALPWTLTDKSVTWESANPEIATVNNGTVTGVGVGETTITVTTVAAPNLTAEIDVSVIEAPVAQINGIIWDENGRGNAATFSSDATQNWTSKGVVGQLRWGALVGDTVYGSTDDTLYAFDADTYDLVSMGGIVADWIMSDADMLPADMAEAYSALVGTTVGQVIGINYYGEYLTMMNPQTGGLVYFNLSDDFGNDPMATITYAGRLDYNAPGSNDALYIVMTESGMMYYFILSMEGDVEMIEAGRTGIDLTGVADPTNSVWASMVYDEENDFIYLSHYDGEDDYAYLYAISAEDPSCNAKIGNFKADVWPVVGLYQYEASTDLKLWVNPLNVTVFATQSAEIEISVKNGETNEYIAKVEDESIVKFADGIVTGLKEGSTTITITTVDVNEAGEHLSAVVNVNVREEFNPGSGEPNDPGTYPEPDPRITGVKQGFYFESDPEDEGWIFWDRDKDGYNWEWATGSDTYTVHDGEGIIHSASYVNNVGAVNPDNFAISPALDLSRAENANISLYACGQDPSWAAEKFAIYAGTTNDPSKMTKISQTYTATGEMRQYVASLKEFAGKDKVYVAIRHFNVSDMFYLNIDAVELLTPDGTGHSVDPAPVSRSANAEVKKTVAKAVIGDGMGKCSEPASKAVNKAAGSLNVVRGTVDVKARPSASIKSAEGSAENGTVTVTLTEDVDVTNGLIEVEYDPELLTFVDAQSGIDYFSVNAEDGIVTFAYAQIEALPAEQTLALLHFSYTAQTLETELTVDTLERNDNIEVEEEPIVIKIGETVTINGVTLALEGRLAVNMLVTAPQTAAKAVMTFHGETEETVEFDLIRDADHYYNANTGQFRLPYRNVAAKEMTCPVDLEVFDANGSKMALVHAKTGPVENNTFSYCVADWCNTIIQTSTNEKSVDLAKALLNYGGFAQKYFNNFNIENPINPEGYLAAETAAVTPDSVLNGTIPDDAKKVLGYSGMTLNLEGDTELRLYFTKDVTAVDEAGISLAFKTQGSKKYISIPGIASVDLDELYKITVTCDGVSREFNVAGLTYANRILASSTNEDLLNLVKALYLYNQMAEIYFNKVD